MHSGLTLRTLRFCCMPLLCLLACGDGTTSRGLDASPGDGSAGTKVDASPRDGQQVAATEAGPDGSPVVDGSSADGAQIADGGDPACSLPFEVGPCDAAMPVWAFVPKLGACFPQIYGGCGGNANRFASRSECEAACPLPSTDGCPPNRVPREICLACGLAGGCPETALTCALICGNGDVCTGATNELGCFDDVCQVGGCI